MALPPPFGPDWDSFVSEWCLSALPGYSSADTERAFSALERLWPERLRSVAAQSARGLAVISHLVHLGLVLEACENLAGFEQVLERARKGERSALGELNYGARLVQVGLTPALEPALEGKVLDTLISVDGDHVYCEVIAPETSDAMQEAEREIAQLAAQIADEHPGKRVEVLLLTDVSPTVGAKVKAALQNLPASEAPVEIEDVAMVSVRDASEHLDLGPTLVKSPTGTVLGVAQFRQDAERRTASIVRLPVTDQRVKRLLSGESHHFSPDHMNVLVINTTGVPGGISTWKPLIQRCLQPDRNRRFGAVLLYFQGLMGEKSVVEQTWAAVPNPYAYKPIPMALMHKIIDPAIKHLP